MARYYLKSPYSEGASLRPINRPGMNPRYYYCSTSATFYALRLAGTDRTLHKVDPSTGKISEEVSAKAPDDWEGEPWKIRVALSIWQSGQFPAIAIRMITKSGDSLVVFDDADPNERIVGELVLDEENRPTLRKVASA